jgi:hypothetical protein
MAVPTIDTDRNTVTIHLPNGTIWFSYQTPIAYRTNDEGLVIRKNAWGPTTGKHLNAINPNKDRRIDGDEFEERITKAFA